MQRLLREQEQALKHLHAEKEAQLLQLTAEREQGVAAVQRASAAQVCVCV